MRKFFLAVLLLFVSISYAAEKVVYIDMQKIFTQSKAGLDIKSILQKKAEEAKAEIQSKSDLINKNDPKAMQQLQMEAMQKQKELQALQQKLVANFANFIKKAVDGFAKKNGYQLVIDKQAVLSGKENLDKTQQFLQFLDKKYEKEKPDFTK